MTYTELWFSRKWLAQLKSSLMPLLSSILFDGACELCQVNEFVYHTRLNLISLSLSLLISYTRFPAGWNIFPSIISWLLHTITYKLYFTWAVYKFSELNITILVSNLVHKDSTRTAWTHIMKKPPFRSETELALTMFFLIQNIFWQNLVLRAWTQLPEFCLWSI